MSPWPLGWSRAPMTLARTSGSASWLESSTMSWWSVPDFSATSLTYGPSGVVRISSGLKFSVWPTKSTAKLRTRSPCTPSCLAAMAVIADESRPPESSMQRGTSAISCRRTMSSRSSRTCRTVLSWSSVSPRVSSCQSDGPHARAVDRHARAGLDLVHAVPQRVAGRLDQREQLTHAVERHDPLDGRVGEDRLGLGAEQDAVG